MAVTKRNLRRGRRGEYARPEWLPISTAWFHASRAYIYYNKKGDARLAEVVKKNIFPRTSSTLKLSTSNCVHIADLITTCCQVDSIMLLSR